MLSPATRPKPNNKRTTLQGVSGADVLLENVRRLCAWKLAGGAGAHGGDHDRGGDDPREGVGEAWWDYVSRFAAGSCGTQEHFADGRCAEAALKGAGLKVAEVEACIEDSGGVGADRGVNTLLRAELMAGRDKNILRLPEVIINNIVLWGGISVTSVLADICHGYAEARRVRVSVRVRTSVRT